MNKNADEFPCPNSECISVCEIVRPGLWHCDDKKCEDSKPFKVESSPQCPWCEKTMGREDAMWGVYWRCPTCRDVPWKRDNKSPCCRAEMENVNEVVWMCTKCNHCWHEPGAGCMP